MRRWDVYRGRRVANTRLSSIVLFLAVLLFLFIVAVFFTLPSYLVYTKDSVHLELPFLQQTEEGEPLSAEAEEAEAEELEEAEDFSDVVAQIEVKAANYEALSLADGSGLDILQSVYVPYTRVNEAGLTSAIARARELEIKALTLELTDQQGLLLWRSETETAINYGLNGAWDVTDTVNTLKEQGYYLTAVISSCINSTLVSRNAGIALKTATGFPYSDLNGAWMDPWNKETRTYTIELAAELMQLGFDEVVLNHVEHPVAEVVYTRTMSGSLTRTNCVTNFAIAVREGLADVMAETGAHLSAMMDTTALNNESVDNGQNLSYFLRIFDRVYEFTETYQEANQVIALGVDSTERFVPIISWTFPGGSWAENYFS